MKEILGYLKYGFVAGLGCSAAIWVWNEFIHVPITDLKDRIERSMDKE